MSPEKKSEGVGAVAVYKARDWSNLPLDLVILISSRLFVFEETIFRAVCKTWRYSVPTYKQLPSALDTTLFYMLRNENSCCKVTNPLGRLALDIKLPSQLAGCEIRCCRNGWLLFARDHVNLSLFNPLSQKIIDEIPQAPDLFPNIWFQPPSVGQCTIVGFRGYLNLAKIGIWKFGDKDWTSYSIPLEWENANHHDLSGGPRMARLGKKFYVMSAEGNVGVFNPKDIRNSFCDWNITVPMHSSSDEQYYADFHSPCYLVKSIDGQLLSIFETIPGRTIKIFSLNLKKRLWKEVHHLGNQTLFLSNGRCFSKDLHINKLRNKIFFPKFAHDNSYMLYCPVIKKFSSLNGQLSTYRAVDLKDFHFACWFTN